MPQLPAAANDEAVRRDLAAIDGDSTEAIPPWRIGLGTPTSRFYVEFGQMLIDELNRAGYRARRVEPGDAEIADLDVLLLVGDGHRMDGYLRHDPQAARKRPTTLLWQMDPLPPEDLDEDSERIGLRVARCNYARLPRLCRKVINFTVPARTKLLHAVRALMAMGLPRPDADSPGPFHGLDAGGVYRVMASWEWIRRRVAEGEIAHVLASTHSRTEFLRRRGAPVSMVPVGYHEDFGRREDRPRDIDVLFLGRVIQKRRRPILKSLQRRLAADGIRMVTVTSGCYGQARTDLLNRSRIVLNLLNFPWDVPGERLLLGMGCGAMVISEPMVDPRPYRPGHHYVEAPLDNLPRAITDYLRDEQRRAQIADAGYRFVTQDFTLRQSAGRVIRAVTDAVAVAGR